MLSPIGMRIGDLDDDNLAHFRHAALVELQGASVIAACC